MYTGTICSRCQPIPGRAVAAYSPCGSARAAFGAGGKPGRTVRRHNADLPPAQANAPAATIKPNAPAQSGNRPNLNRRKSSWRDLVFLSVSVFSPFPPVHLSSGSERAKARNVIARAEAKRRPGEQAGEFPPPCKGRTKGGREKRRWPGILNSKGIESLSPALARACRGPTPGRHSMKPATLKDVASKPADAHHGFRTRLLSPPGY